MGVECTRAALARGDLHPIAAIVSDPAKDGRDLGELCGLGRSLGAPACTDADSVLARPDVDVVFLCGFVLNAGLVQMMERASAAGKDAIAYSGLVHPATALGSDGARALDQVARRNGTRMLGTGWLGYFTDALPIAIATLSVDWSEIRVNMVHAMDEWGVAALDAYRIGSPAADYEVETGRLSPLEAVGVIADGLAVEITDLEVEQRPIVADERIDGKRIVEAGQTRGVHKRFSATASGGRTITLDETVIYGLSGSEWHEEYVIEIVGISPGSGVRAEFTAGWTPDPYPSTAACGVNAVRGLRSLPPGLYTAAQVPSAVRRDDWPDASLRRHEMRTAGS